MVLAGAGNDRWVDGFRAFCANNYSDIVFDFSGEEKWLVCNHYRLLLFLFFYVENMKFADKIKPLSDLKKNTTQILDQIKTTQSPVIIKKNGQATAVLQDIESYEKTKQALLLLKLISQAETDIQKGNISSHEKVMKRIEKKLAIGKEICE